MITYQVPSLRPAGSPKVADPTSRPRNQMPGSQLPFYIQHASRPLSPQIFLLNRHQPCCAPTSPSLSASRLMDDAEPRLFSSCPRTSCTPGRRAGPSEEIIDGGTRGVVVDLDDTILHRYLRESDSHMDMLARSYAFAIHCCGTEFRCVSRY
ncbi:hypothetical protein BKA82DRAFT_1000344 [Pisolithus tinctorius]|uniref:Uncharacterized protein n=1 Tax=Pisolithus tinctorius Marx 270 TaxID=870435 RepID=A0A0C3PAY3_PISTI|nr:hypothetical protein BKA82DRAFT_1000344 [Pisolithus tinctorius]KIO04804.1 hypothetical protein M404DRAFT_1000344 [Pisolithus tinctorius Marx 270]